MEIYNFDPHVKGNTFLGKEFAIDISGTPPDLTGATIKMQLRLTPVHPTEHELSTTNNKIEINDAVGGHFQIKEQIIDFPASNYYYDIQITYASGKIRTYIGGYFPILQNITN
ncbi:MAG: hypothetical protein ACYC2U_08300 [Candidatus Amoebophilus sp.]